MATSEAVTIPGMAVRSTTVDALRHLENPNATAASFKADGTSFTISSVARVTNGMMSNPSAIPPASAENRPDGRTTSSHTKTPSTMEGRPLKTSATKATIVARRVPRRSAAKRPAPMPIGTPMPAPIPTSSMVPTIALAIPPPRAPAGAGTLVKNEGEKADAPPTIKYSTMATSGRMATVPAIHVRLIITRPCVRRRASRRARAAGSRSESALLDDAANASGRSITR